ncbi:MAG: amino acid permease-associated protein, partial [Pseudonocardiales bacterium]|nr:amino acid permease-associated protein [Pseudonocardiales bacterium]
ASWVAIALVPAGLIALGLRPDDAFVSLVTLATFGYMLAYILVCAALPRFLHQIGELTRPALVAGLVAGLVLLATFALYASPSARTNRWLLMLAGAAVVGGTALSASRARRRPEARIGVYDEPIASDLLETVLRRAS